MKILLVEDDSLYVKNIEQQLSKIRGDIQYRYARSLESAELALNNDVFDLAILDLKIPTVDDAMDAEPEHGTLVFEYARKLAPGTPLFVLTGSEPELLLDSLQDNISQVDIWGSGTKLRTVTYVQKHKFGATFLEKIRPYLAGHSMMMDIELEGALDEIDEKDRRLIRIFVNSKKGVKCTVAKLSGGLSGAKVLKLNLTDATGVPLLLAVAKLGSQEDVASENRLYEHYIDRLEGYATPRKLGLNEHGAGNLCGVFYSLAAGYETDAFSLALLNAEASETVVSRISELTQQWRTGLAETRKTIHDIRANELRDEKFLALRERLPFTWLEEFEKKYVQTILACCHGDLHGKNVLAAADGAAILIDYGDVGPRSGAWDAITLEFSLIFHKEGPFRSSSWPTLEQARNWGDLDAYLQGCPAPRFIRSCRNWAIDCSAGTRDLAATAYAYFVKQVKYEDTDKDRAYAFIEGAKSLFERT